MPFHPHLHVVMPSLRVGEQAGLNKKASLRRIGIGLADRLERAARQETAPERRLLHAPVVALDPPGARLAEVTGCVVASGDVVG